MSRIFTKLAVATAISLIAGLGLTGSVSPASAAETCPGGTPAENTNPANQAPVVIDDTAAVQAGSSVIVRVLANDTDPDGDQLAVVSTKTSKGVTCIGAKGLIRYTPNVGKYDRTDTFTYGVTDGDYYRTGTVTLAVTGLKPLKPVLKKRLLLKPNGKVKQLARVAFTNPNSKRVLLFVEGMNTGRIYAERYLYPGRTFAFPARDRQLFFGSVLAPKTGEFVLINVGRLNTRNGAMYSEYVGESFERSTEARSSAEARVRAAR